MARKRTEKKTTKPYNSSKILQANGANKKPRTFIKSKPKSKTISKYIKTIRDAIKNRSRQYSYFKYDINLIRRYTHKLNLHVFKYKIDIRNGGRDEYGMFDTQTIEEAVDEMIRLTIRDYPYGRIRVVPIHPIILTKHGNWPIRTYEEVNQLFWDQMERLLQSAEEIDLNEVVFEVTIYPNSEGRGVGKTIIDEINKRSIRHIKNNDTICLARSIVVSLAINEWLGDAYTKHEIDYIKRGRGVLQTKIAKDLHGKANILIKERGNNFDDLKEFEDYLKTRIIVFSSNNTEYITYKGNDKYPEHIYLYYHDNHFDTIANIAGFLGKRKFCKTCIIGYTDCHLCNGVLQSRLEQWTCKECNKTFSISYQKQENHICGEIMCPICYTNYMKGDNHKCYMKPLKPKEVKNSKYIYFDFEANQETGIHIMNFCIAYDGEYVYCFRKNYIQRCECDFNIDSIDLSKVDIDDCFKDIEKLTCKNDNVTENFCKYFIRDKFKNYTFLSHYGKGYDMQPILGWIVKNKIDNNIISSGLKLTAIFIKGINIRFIDSINFTLCALSAFPNTFGFKGNKGYFPHFFNINENQNYKGEYPPIEDYGYNEMSNKNKEALKKWHNNVKDKEFNFKREMFHYCLLDVLILAKGCTIFKSTFIKITENYIDPFQSITIAQCCTKIFKTLMLEEGTIGIHPKTTLDENNSKKEIKWLEYLRGEYNINIRHYKRGGEKTIYINKKYYKLDGYYYDHINKISHIYEFFGCYFHGCPKCFNPEEVCKREKRFTMKELYSKTIERLDIIKEYFKGKCEIHTIWECEFDKNKYPEVDPELTPINKRDAFYGGRTETIQLLNKDIKSRKQYIDFCSLYPTINKTCEYPIGHPINYKNVLPEEYKINKYFGIIKCQILPPNNLYHPVLPFKQKTNENNHKLIFGLCKSCMNGLTIKCTHIDFKKFNSNHEKSHALKHCEECKKIRNKRCNHTKEERALIGTWATIEVDKAIEKGYKILKIYEIEHFEERSTTIFKKYVNTFMKYKLEASGCKCNSNICKEDCKNDDNCETKKKYVLDNTEYKLNKDKIELNPGLRLISKICLNSLWGHFGMKESFTKQEYCFIIDQLTNIVYNNKYEDVNTIILDEDVILADYKTKQEYTKPNTSVNIYIALFTSANARLKLYEILDILQELVIYIDTDSAVYIDDGSEACKKVQKLLGSNLGELTDEVAKLGASHITRFASTGPKDYSFELDTGKIVNHCKGLRVNSEVERKITLDKKIKLITNKNENYEILKYKQLVQNKKDRNIRTTKQEKMYDYNFDKRMAYIVNEDVVKSYPYGYKL